MRICVPSQSNAGFGALICHHFGSAPFFSIYDTEKQKLDVIKNGKDEHEHGTCNPKETIAGLEIDTVIGYGIGRRALAGLMDCGIKVYKTSAKYVSDIIGNLDENMKEELSLDDSCTHGKHVH